MKGIIRGIIRAPLTVVDAVTDTFEDLMDGRRKCRRCGVNFWPSDGHRCE